MTPLDIACVSLPLSRPDLRWVRRGSPALAAAIVCLVTAGFVIPAPRAGWPHGNHFPRVELAIQVVNGFASEAYVAWRRDHPDDTCPLGLGELAGYLDKHDIRDPWGLYQFTCGDHGIYVMSLGPDNLLGTDDDIWSRP